MKAAVYTRVSTDNQEREGTSLQTQLENCLTYCRGKGYDVSYRFSEAYSGLSLERPELDKLRELVRTEAIDVLVCHSLDRLSRDPVHGVIITQELEKHHIGLEAVTETIDSSEVGKLITYIKGFAAKLDAERRREATLRGRKACAREGRMPGGFHTTYGYDYVRTIRGERQARRVINEAEASWVSKIYDWLVTDGLTTGAIRDRLIAGNASTKHGKPWCKAVVIGILKNPAYCGRTYAFTSIKRKPRSKPQSEWIEVTSDVTPAIITLEIYEAAQKRLQANRDKAARNTKREYLLRGRIKCRQCGYSYAGGITTTGRKDGDRYRRIYRCLGQWKENTARRGERCHNRTWRADTLENQVWAELERYLSKPELIVSQLEAQKEDANQLSGYEIESEQTGRQLRVLDREQKELLDNALRGFPESLVIAENKKINSKRETLKARQAGLAVQLKASHDAVISIPKLEGFIARMQAGISTLDFEGKRQALDMLGIRGWLDGETVEVTGTIDVEASVTATTPCQGHWLKG